MRTLLVVATLLAACGSSGSSSNSAAAVARGFVDAMVAGDVEAARRFLPDDQACEIETPGVSTEQCKESAAAMRAQIGAMVDDFPEGARVKSITRADAPTPGPDMAVWTVELDVAGETDIGEVMTFKLGDRFYAGFPTRKKESGG